MRLSRRLRRRLTVASHKAEDLMLRERLKECERQDGGEFDGRRQ